MALADGEVFAGYTILRILGAGGMGEVYLAQHPRLPRRDALKVLGKQVSHDAEYRQRFNQEAEMVATLSHPHIVTIYDRGECDEKLWIAMDFVDGTDAGRLLSDHYPTGIPAAEVVRIVTAIADALDYAHGRGLLHRDIKPANILLGEDARIMLADFGVARWVGQASELTGTEMTVGTVTYAAPEQLKGEEIDGHADQYALAATAYHLLTGAAPFVNSNPAVVISQHLAAEPPAIGTGHPELARFAPAFAKALAKNPAKRYACCRDFAAALQAALTQTGAAAGTSGARHRKTSTKSKRVRRTVVAAGVLALVGAAIVAVDIWAHHRHTETVSPPSPPPAVSARMDLPVVVMGADCAVLGAAAVDATGNDAYCARVNSQTDQTVWSSIPERLRAAG